MAKDGQFVFKLEEYLLEHNISKNKLSKKAKLQRTQLNLYCRNQVSRLDFKVLARICAALECEVAEILDFVPAEDMENVEEPD